MLDFLMIASRPAKRGVTEIYPKFIVKRSSDLMIRGGDFYAIWLEEKGLWSTDEQDALQAIDRELDIYAKEHASEHEGYVKILHMWDAENRMIRSWHDYCKKDMRDHYHQLDEKLIFSNNKPKKRDYASKALTYPLEECDTPAYEKLISTLYSPEERNKLEWAIGSIVSGDSKKIQKFLVLYGSAGTGKSTILNIIQQLFDGYYAVFDAKALGSSSNSFALEAFKSNPLVAIQHDGDLSHIEDNTRLNSLVSHELMTVNEKFKSTYSNQFKAFLFMGTNKPVKITDAKSGLIRRLIDVSPSGNKLSSKEYKAAVKQIEFELGGIAKHCLEVYKENPGKYDDYIPLNMMGASNDFYNYCLDNYSVFEKEDGVSLRSAWELYKIYCEEARVPYPLSRRIFQEELKNYFHEYFERYSTLDGTRVRSYYSGFRKDRFEIVELDDIQEKAPLLTFNCTKSLFDDICKDMPAQYASKEETPSKRWDNVTTTLKDIQTDKLHYVKVPENHVVIDFDIPDESGKKCFEKNLEEASKWPKTYAELSKSGAGIHLHYIYDGDPKKLSRIYAEHIEIKVYTGKSSLRRKLSKCNDIPIAHLNSGLPLKGEKMVNFEAVQSEKTIRNGIKKNLNKEVHPATKPSIDFIEKILDDAYKAGISYDVSDMRNAVLGFAASSTHHADYCMKRVLKMHFKSDDISEAEKAADERIVFYDVEVFPNLFLVNYKFQGKDKPVLRMINPTPEQIEELCQYNLVGFNCRRYDNHILYARAFKHYDNEQLYLLSKKIVEGKSRDCFFGEAYNLSYTDVYDFSSKKQSLKKFEIELGIHHQELGLPWDKPVPEELWQKVAEYCDNDVIATEAVFEARKSDWLARQILADVAGMSVNDTTNSLTTRIIFGKERHPQELFNYRNMGDTSKESAIIDPDIIGDPKWTKFDELGRPIFPGYEYKYGVSTYRDICPDNPDEKRRQVGEGGFVYAEPGMYTDVALLDIASMHPSSIVAENLFGPYTKNFNDILQARIAIKHKEFDKAKQMLDGKLSKYLDDENAAADLAQALKIAINSVYGLTSASFENPFRDPRNIDNIVAKRGALFMINLKHEVQARGFTVAHIKTDSIKIPNATPEIIRFVMDYGKQYGYNFEHEATYDRMCLVNDAVYIAKYKGGKHDGEWTATGTQFQVPYVFKTLFSKEPIKFEDTCETKSVTSALYLDMNEGLNEGEHDYRFIGRVGSFCPIKPERGGGELVRDMVDKDGNVKYTSATGAKGYRWLEAEEVRNKHLEYDIDHGYYHRLVNEALDNMAQYGDVEWFIGEKSLPDYPLEDELPF